MWYPGRSVWNLSLIHIWHLQANIGELGSLSAQGIQGYLEARQDHSADVVSLLVHDAHRGGGAHVDDHQGQRMFMAGSHCVHNHIASHGFGVRCV